MDGAHRITTSLGLISDGSIVGLASSNLVSPTRQVQFESNEDRSSDLPCNDNSQHSISAVTRRHNETSTYGDRIHVLYDVGNFGNSKRTDQCL